MKFERLLSLIKFDEKGLIPVIVVDYKTKDILMFAYMNQEALLQTIKTSKMTYYSRSRKKLWVKGEESGNLQHIKKIFIDCDGDVLLFHVEQEGVACHTGHYSCFYREYNSGADEFIEISDVLISPEDMYKKRNKE